MTTFVVGLVLFFGAHYYSAFRSRAPQRDIKQRMGEKPYMAVYSLISLLGFAMLIYGYGQSEVNNFLYAPRYEFKWLSLCLMLPAFILLTAAYVPGARITSLVKHPMLLGVALWAVAHLLLISHQAAVWLFGSFLLFAIIDFISASKRGPPATGAITLAWEKYDLWAVIIGTTLYLIFLYWGHQAVFGVSPL